jgi:folate-binding protein YgfZ
MAGIPTLFPPTVEAFVPQMANLDLIGGISFEKGCYPGQEIIARTHYRGRLKQRMYRGHVQNPVPPQPGDALYAPNLPGQTAGTIVDAQPSPHGGYDLLAVIQISSVEQGELHLESIEGARVKIEELPYPLPGAEARRQPV